MRRTVISLFSVVVVLIAAVAAAEMMHCTECGMMVDPASRFSSRVIRENTSLPFCDIGDMLTYLNKNKDQGLQAEVKDYGSGDWIDASKASYVHDGKKFNTPMGWGIAAFRDQKQAAANGKVMDCAAARKAVQ